MTMKTTRLPRVGDIWLAHYPYLTPGNMEKIRPCIIIGFVGEDKVRIQKLTTRKKKQNKLFKHAKLKKTTYLSPEVINIYEYNLIRYVGHI